MNLVSSLSARTGSCRKAGAGILILMVCGASLTSAAKPMREAITSQLPKFDPAAGTPRPAAIESDPKTRATLVRLPAAAVVASPRPTSTPPKQAAKEPVVVMPQMTVSGKPGEVVAPNLPKLAVTRPLKDLPAEQFESGSAKAERLVEKHLTSLDRLFLSRYTSPLFGRPKEDRARDIEAVATTAAGLNEVAEGIESSFWTGRTAAEKKQLKELYYDVIVSRPK